MNAHRVKVFNRTNDNAIVHAITDNFHFKFFPADQRFFNEEFIGWGRFKATTANRFEFLFVVGDAATGSSQSERRSDDDRETELFLDIPGFFQSMGDTGTG